MYFITFIFFLVFHKASKGWMGLFRTIEVYDLQK